GTAVTIGGTDFQTGATVTFGGTSATSVAVVSSTQITCATPAHAAGAVDVVVTNPDAQTATAAGGFTYVAAPSVASVTPNQGPAVGGTAVTIGGTGFQTGATVTFGGTSATSVVVVSSTQITCATPAHAAGAVNVVVANPDGQSGTLAGGFTYVAAPSIVSLDPREGPAVGGTPATIGGTDFQTGATVTFGGALATSVVVVSSTQITCVTPAGAPGLVTLEVENPDGQKATWVNAYQYVPPPVVSSVTPSQGPVSGGTAVTIGGTSFQTGATVTFGGTSATSVVVVSSTQITCATPAHAAGAVAVEVVNPDAQSGTLAGGFTFVAGPTIASVDPLQGPTAGGTAATIAGTGFQTGAVVRFGGASATNVAVVSPTQITCTTPSHAAGLVTVEVQNTDGQTASAASAFEYVAPPAVTGVAPSQGPTSGGTAATVSGTGFRAGASVRFGGTAATNVVVVSSSQITCTTPAHAAGAVAVEVANPDGQSGTLAGGFTYDPPPTVATVDPSEGPTSGGTSVTIGGTDFRAGAAAIFGGVEATSVVVVSSTQITCSTPPRAAGIVDVVVRNADGQTGTKASGFRYYEPLTIASISPSSGPAAGGTAAEITGTGFLAGATVGFGGVAATDVVVVSLTRITCTTPAHAAGFVDVVVTNPDGRTATRSSGFEYLAAPTIASISPTSGPEAGGTFVRITGTALRAGATVLFGGSAAGNVNVVSATELTCNAPAHAPGVVDVEVRNPDGQAAVSAGGFTYTANAGITSITPTSGPTAGGTTVAIAGAGFQTGATVTFGGTSATSVVVVSSTQITCTTPVHGAGVVDVTVTNPDLQSATLPSAFEFIPPPTVGSVSPSSGPTAGGTPVAIAGTGFRAGATVRFGTADPVPSTFVSSTSLSCTTPAQEAGAVRVTVVNPDGQEGARDGAFEYIASPQVASISPASGPTAGGTPVVILGSGFRSGATVAFGGVAGEDVVVVSATRITCATPPHAGGMVDVVVRNMDGQSATLASGYQYIPAPSIASVTPSEGPITGATRTTILGSGFQPDAEVTFGGYAATEILIVSAGEITCRTPAVPAAGAVAVQVRNADGQRGTLASGFTYFGAPDITDVQPPQGPVTGGTLVTISGAGFRSGAAVTFDGISATNITVVSSTQITCRTPAHAAGYVAVAVAIEGGLSKTLAQAFRYVAGPAVQSITPTSGPTAGGTRVTIAGENFQDGAAVFFDATPATQVMVASPTTMLCTAPAHAAGRVAVSVQNTDGQSSSLPDAFEYIPPPQVLAVAPGSGPAAGGTAVTIDGEAFRAGAAVAFGGVSATNVTLVSATRITCTTPPHAPGIVAVAVTNADGQSAALPAAFEFIPPPEVSGISPASGPTAGGTAVEITGSGFRAGAVVLLGGASASNVVVASATRITCTTPVHGAGIVAVVVQNADGQSATLAAGFQYVGPPILSSVSPASGSVVGGASVALDGGGFQAGATVTFGGISASNVVVVSDARITCTTPAHAAGAVDVIVRNPDGQTATLPAGYSYIPAPRIDSLDPASGPAAGGALVTVHGAAFQAGATVRFGGVAATGVEVLSDAELRCVTPAHAAGAVDVIVRNPDGQQGVLAAGYVYQPGPTIASVSPTRGPTAGGTDVTIRGQEFVGGAEVLFGDTAAAAVTVISATEIQATTPPRPAGAADVIVRNPDGQSAIRAGGFTFLAPPHIDRIDPVEGPAKGGIWVSLFGSGFGTEAKVTFGGVAATLVVVVSGTEITCLAPPHPAGGRVDVRVWNADGQEHILVDGFYYIPPPQVIRITPESGRSSGGTAVTIEGLYFQSGAQVLFGGTPATGVVVATAEIIQCVTPAHAPGFANVTVRNPDGEEWIAPSAFFYLAEFRRGDCNVDGSVNVSDAVIILRYLFDDTLASVPTCDLACDANASERITVSDAVYLLLFLFGGGSPPDGGVGCQPVPEDGVLGCRAYGACQ
ncbi:MAG: IPT/TIG domain-containing protein, partial [Planctomycetes bacterium]|nr:IPT/TIG domain-containing protein [Planctomycetota bacterium]